MSLRRASSFPLHVRRGRRGGRPARLRYNNAPLFAHIHLRADSPAAPNTSCRGLQGTVPHSHEDRRGVSSINHHHKSPARKAPLSNWRGLLAFWACRPRGVPLADGCWARQPLTLPAPFIQGSSDGLRSLRLGLRALALGGRGLLGLVVVLDLGVLGEQRLDLVVVRHVDGLAVLVVAQLRVRTARQQALHRRHVPLPGGGEEGRAGGHAGACVEGALPVVHLVAVPAVL
mmetsp:Transcript_32300/g.70482  ORF Transcript_32300/g.70482 Transcript_32300/m.70482 type:complete len:230 (+) Transcript_32300:62-751(+)